MSQISDASELSGLQLSNANKTHSLEVLQGRSVGVLRALDYEAHVRLLKCSPVFNINTQQSTAVAASPNPDGVSAEGQPGRNTTPPDDGILNSLTRPKEKQMGLLSPHPPHPPAPRSLSTESLRCTFGISGQIWSRDQFSSRSFRRR